LQQTPNYALKKIDLADSPPDITVMNPNWDKIDQVLKDIQDAINSGATDEELSLLRQDLAAHLADDTSHVPYAVATGTANAYATTINPAPTAYVDGMAVTIKINVQNTGASTVNINSLGAKPIKKSNGNDVASGNLKAGVPYTLRYNGTNFILQGEGASGNATASDLLSGKTASTDAGDIVGAMINNSAVTITPGTTAKTIPAGYHNGSGTVAGDADLVAENIKKDIDIFGVVGTLDLASLGGKKWASGTTITSSVSEVFTYISGGGEGKQFIEVTGLSFKPSLIYLTQTSGSYSHIIVYDELGGLYPKPVKNTNFNNGNYGATSKHFKGDVLPAYVDSTGFKLPATAGYGTTYNWIAIE
jgi:hypothetical protein